MADKNDVIYNERVKLTANFLNGLAVAMVAVGAFAPFVSYASRNSNVSLKTVALFAIGCLLIAISLHLRAVFHLRKLK
ncbi:amino acid transporter [uncultured Nitratireductor sp.]|mgnify:CR=1 FL=1|uniref:amino acid transporter n=1 Tax=uncultured Nitratireductor sp. TaxID=520953 RepID=UPI0025EE4058|nr:amino acid transporter [uncultured Nitratireductor sp.]